MSRKSKVARKRPNRPRPAGQRPAATAAPESAGATADDELSALSVPAPSVTQGSADLAVAHPPGARRGVGRLEPGAAAVRRRERAARPGSLSAGFEPLDPADPSIPYDRVPYVPADLRRVAIIAGTMILLILLADIIVSHAVK